MKTRRFIRQGAVVGGFMVVFVGMRWLTAAQGVNFDRLSDADRKVFAERFRNDIWPLLTSAKKKEDSCVGCHSKSTIVSSLRMAGDADKDFRMLLREGFFLKDDPGSLLERIKDPTKNRKMPPGDRPPWTDAEKKILSAFVNDVHAKQKR